jgi:hypothetical protein
MVQSARWCRVFVAVTEVERLGLDYGGPGFPSGSHRPPDTRATGVLPRRAPAGCDGPCNDSPYTTARANFSTLKRPLIWLPGDNDWTDCWGRYGAAQAPYHDPIERLNIARHIFDSTSRASARRP